MMIKKVLGIIAIAALFAACNCEQNNADANKEETKTVEVAGTPLVELAAFDAEAAKYVDKEIKVIGIVDHVCKHGGKKLFLVADGGDLHVESEERFEEDLMGSKIEVTGIVREFRVDEAYVLKMEEDNIQQHKSGEIEDNVYEHKMENVKFYRDSMATAKVDHISFYSLDYVSLKEVE